MDEKKSPKGKKRQKQMEDHLWECSACTYRNNPEAFKCCMCQIRKGTSTRKPKLNPDMVEVQVQKHAFTPPSPHVRGYMHDRPGSSASNDATYQDDDDDAGPSGKAPKKIKMMEFPGISAVKQRKTTKPKKVKEETAAKGKKMNVDRKTGTVHEVTVDNVTISITEYKVKSKKERKVDGGKETEGRFAGSSNRNSDAESDTQETSQSLDASFQDSRSS